MQSIHIEENNNQNLKQNNMMKNSIKNNQKTQTKQKSHFKSSLKNTLKSEQTTEYSRFGIDLVPRINVVVDSKPKIARIKTSYEIDDTINPLDTNLHLYENKKEEFEKIRINKNLSSQTKQTVKKQLILNFRNLPEKYMPSFVLQGKLYLLNVLI